MSRRKDPSSVRICDVLLEMRRCRMGLIQTADQLRFSYLAVIEGAKYIMGDSSLQVGRRLRHLGYFYRKSNRGPFLPPSEGIVARALKRGRRPAAVLPSSSSAAPPGTTQRQNRARGSPRTAGGCPTGRDPQPGVNTGAPLDAAFSCVCEYEL